MCVRERESDRETLNYEAWVESGEVPRLPQFVGRWMACIMGEVQAHTATLLNPTCLSNLVPYRLTGTETRVETSKP